MTKIEWTEKTWNPIVGCSIVSPGCTNCYAMQMAARIERMDRANRMAKATRPLQTIPLGQYAGLTKTVNGKAVWTGKLALAPEHILLEPLRRKKPTMWFVNSMSDLFHEDVPDEWIDQVFAVMSLCPQHTFQVLTKRSARMQAYLTKPRIDDYWFETDIFRQVNERVDNDDAPNDSPAYLAETKRLEDARARLYDFDVVRHLPNVWLGVSAERQQEADARIPDLLATPAAVRFVSAEPLLGLVDFTALPSVSGIGRYLDSLSSAGAAGSGVPNALDWIIVGGESGRDARPMHPDWARSIRDQCQAAGVAFFFKQWGEWAPGTHVPPGANRLRTAFHVSDGCEFGTETAKQAADGHYDDEPDLYRVGKSVGGRLLDGREWNEMPTLQREQVPA